jgi:hypothetical protein
MTWGEMEMAVQQANDKEKAVCAAVRRALHEEPLLEEFLRRYLEAGSYSPGREYHQVAFSEGQRALARLLLNMGGQTLE